MHKTALDDLDLSSQTQTIIAPDTSQNVIDDANLEIILEPYTEYMLEIADELSLEVSTVFKALFACRGDFEDAKAFLTGNYDAMKRLPIPKEDWVKVYNSNKFPED